MPTTQCYINKPSAVDTYNEGEYKVRGVRLFGIVFSSSALLPTPAEMNTRRRAGFVSPQRDGDRAGE